MAEDEKKVEEEVKEEKPKPQKPIEQLAPIERRPELSDLLELFTAKTGMQKQAAIPYLTKLMADAGASPETDLDEAVRFGNNLVNVLKLFPDLPLTAQTKDAAMSAGVSKMVQKMTTTPDADERMGRILDRILPYTAVMPMVREMMRATGGGEDSNPQVAKLEAKLASVEERLKEKPIEELKSTVQSLREEIAALKAGPKEDSEGKMVGAIKELRNAIIKREEAEKEDRVVSSLKALEERLAKIAEAPPKERESLIKEMADEVQGTTSGLKSLKDSLVELGVVKEEEVTTKSGKINWGTLANKALKVVEEGVKSMKARTPPRVTVETQPVPQPEYTAPPTEVKVEEPKVTVEPPEEPEKPPEPEPEQETPEPEPEKPPEPELEPEKPAEEKPSEAPKKEEAKEGDAQ